MEQYVETKPLSLLAGGISDADKMLAYYLLHTGDDSNPRLAEAAFTALNYAKNYALIEFFYNNTSSEENICRWANTSKEERKEALISVIGLSSFQLVVNSPEIVERYSKWGNIGLNQQGASYKYSAVLDVSGAKGVLFPDLSEQGRILATRDNLAALLRSMGLEAAQNAMTLELELLESGKPVAGSLEGKRSYLISAAAISGLPKSAIDDHLSSLCEQRLYHPVVEWLSKGEWDGIQRVDKVIDAINAKDRDIAKIAMRKWFVAAIAALYESTFECKLVPVLQGKQSFKKTAFISRLASVVEHSFLEGAELNPDNKDSVLSSIKSWIVELGELERTSKNSQGSLKAFITKRVDSVRPPYARADIKKKRQSVFIASVNGTEFLRDETGSTRYAVIELEKSIDMESVNLLLGWTYVDGRISLSEPESLRQFWLEVKAQYDSGATWMLSQEELAFFNKVNNQHKYKDDYRIMLEERFLGVSLNGRAYQWLKASEVCQYCDLSSKEAKRVGRALSAMANDGLIEMRSERANVKRYKLPVIVTR